MGSVGISIIASDWVWTACAGLKVSGGQHKEYERCGLQHNERHACTRQSQDGEQENGACQSSDKTSQKISPIQKTSGPACSCRDAEIHAVCQGKLKSDKKTTDETECEEVYLWKLVYPITAIL